MRRRRLTRVEPPYTDPYVRWCGRPGPQGPRLPDVRRAWREAACMVHVAWEPARETEPGSDLEVRVLWRP
jgi:hypothetical protein